MVASSVYGFESELNQLCAVLGSYGFEVWNSHLGTIQNHPGKSNLENCLDAVRLCDVFLGVIRPFYGTGVARERSITHEEMRLAVSLNKPRWFLVHDHVTFARQLFRQFLIRKDGKPKKRRLAFKKTAVLDDLRVFQMYDDVVQSDVPVEDRKGTWAQEFHTLSEALVYLRVQFGNVDRVRQIVKEMNAL
jgi:hypothetical protein